MPSMKEVVEGRGIEYLLHFTRLNNLQSIMERGLIPRSRLEVEGIGVTFNDDYRRDGCPNATSLSITFPNYKMFWACRKEFEAVEWIILEIHPSVLWEKDCAFCHENAASNAVTCIPSSKRKGVDAFNRLFEEIDGKPHRKDLGIPDRATTNPQAEVLVFDIIEPEFIIGVLVENQDVANKAKTLSKINPEICPLAFKPRKDYTHWKSSN